MSECSLSGRGRGHVSNFYIVDLENFATASHRYTGDIHNLTVVGLFMTPTLYKTMKATRMRYGWVHMFITYRPTLTLQLHNFDLFRTLIVVQVVSALLRGNRQDLNWHNASRGPSAIAELLVYTELISYFSSTKHQLIHVLCCSAGASSCLTDLLLDATKSYLTVLQMH